MIPGASAQIFAAGFARAANVKMIDVPFKGGIGEKTERPASTAELKSEYHLAIGELKLDLGAVGGVALHLP